MDDARSLLSPVIVLAAAGSVAGPAAASGPSDLGTVDLAQDLVLDELTDSPGVLRAQPHTIFTNFDGAQLRGGSNDSHTDSTRLGQCAGAFPAFGDDGSVRAAVLQATRQDWAPFGITITDERPASGAYTMVMVGRWQSCCGSGGVAPVDCGTSNLNSVAFSCQGAGSPLGAGAQAGVISQEAAHTYGLMHVNDSTEIMNPSIGSGSDPTFKDECYSYSPQVCSSQRTHCGDGRQNSVQELLEFFGSAVPDTMAPLVSVAYPEHGDRFEVGADFDIVAEASDDVSVVEVELRVNDEDFGASDGMRWHVQNIPQGVYAIEVTAADAAGNQTRSDVVQFTVGDAAPSDPDEMPSPSGGDSDGGALPSGFGTDDEASVGCGCRSGGPSGGQGWVVFAVMVGAGAPKRRHRPRS